MSGPTPNMTDSAADGAGSVTPDALQRPKWSPERLDPAPGTHVTSAATRLRGTLDESVLATAVADTLRHHPEISTRWADGDGVPVLLTNPRSEQDDLARADIHTTETARACEEFLPTLTASLKPRSFAAALIALGPDDHVLLLVLHETVRGINAAGLITEIGARYGVAAPDGGHAADAAPAPADRPDEAWLDLLTSTPAAEAPADRPRAHVRDRPARECPSPCRRTFPRPPVADSPQSSSSRSTRCWPATVASGPVSSACARTAGPSPYP